MKIMKLGITLAVVASAVMLFFGCAEEQSVNDQSVAQSNDQLHLAKQSDVVIEGKVSKKGNSAFYKSSLIGSDIVLLEITVNGQKIRSEINNATGVMTTQTDSFLMDDGKRIAFNAISKAVSKKIKDKSSLAEDKLLKFCDLWSQGPEGPVISHTIEYDIVTPVWTRLCNGTSYRTFSFTNDDGTDYSAYLKYGPGETSNPCRARCGPGCDGIGTSAWTVDCGNHDRCADVYGWSKCDGLWWAASDDYMFAPNCSY